MIRIIGVLFIVINFGCFAQAQSSKLLDRANAYYSIRQYSQAITDFERYLGRNDNSDARIKLGDCYVKTAQQEKALLLYEKELAGRNFSDTLTIIYADLLKQKKEYKKAKEQYSLLVKQFPLRENYSVYANYCDSALHFLDKSNEIYSVENLKQINSEFSEITPVQYKNGLVFSSNREEVIIKKKTDNTNQPLFDLYYAYGKDSILPDKVAPFSSKLNSIHHECCASFTSNFNKIFYTRSIDAQPGDNRSIRNTLKMYSATWSGSNWQEIQTFRFNDTTHSYGQPSVGAEEELFFFASDRAGGYGGTDLYVCFNIDHKWTDPVNLGPSVNSAYNELYPFMHADGTIYFSSNRPEGFGGYDIYMAVENEEGDFVQTKNVGSPINSPSDDVSIFWSPDNTIGYLSTNRPGGKGGEDIYCIKKK